MTRSSGLLIGMRFSVPLFGCDLQGRGVWCNHRDGGAGSTQVGRPNSMGMSRVLAPFVAQVIIANPLQVKAIAQAQRPAPQNWSASESGMAFSVSSTVPRIISPR